MSVRHRFKAWILWDQVVCFFRNAPATIYWWIVAIVVWLPIIVIGVLVAPESDQRLRVDVRQARSGSGVDVWVYD